MVVLVMVLLVVVVVPLGTWDPVVASDI